MSLMSFIAISFKKNNLIVVLLDLILTYTWHVLSIIATLWIRFHEIVTPLTMVTRNVDRLRM